MNNTVEKTEGSGGEIVLYQPDEKTTMACTKWLAQYRVLVERV